jgi:hypothetical protein
MTSNAHQAGLLVRVVTTPRLRPILTAMAAIVLLTGVTLPVSVLAAPAAAAPLVAATTFTAPTPAAIVERTSSDRIAPIGAVATQPTVVSVVKAVIQPVVKPVVKPIVKIAPPKIALVAPTPVVYKGTNHVWIPALGVDRSVYGFACTRSKAPDNLTYLWGCAGTNNVYLLGHAYGVFKPLHDAYYNGKLKKGLKVMYADATGTVHTYSVLWWKVVKPTTDASWAWAPLSSPGHDAPDLPRREQRVPADDPARRGRLTVRPVAHRAAVRPLRKPRTWSAGSRPLAGRGCAGR